MRRINAVAIVLVAILLAGCATSAETRWYQQRAAVTTAEEITLAWHRADRIDDETLVEMDPYIQTAREMLDRASEYLPMGGPTFDQYLAAAAEAMREVTAQQEGAE